MNTDMLNEIFNMEDAEEADIISETKKSGEVIPSAPQSTKNMPVFLTQNEQYIDEQIKDVVDSVDEAKDDILNLARITESPRAFEVYSTLLNTKLNALSKLADIEKTRIKNGPETVNNTQINIDSGGVNINELLNSIKKDKGDA